MEYQLAQETWKDAEVISVYAPDGRFLAEFPASFVRDGGVPTWAFVLDVLSEILQPISGTALTRETTGALMSAEGAVEGGDYILHVDDHSTVSFARGPEYFRRGIAANTEAGQSTRSRSKSRSTPNQSNFRFFVSVRDSQCLVTGAEAENCTAAHIIPQSRPDLYQQVLQLRRNPPLFSPSSGVLLEDALHRAWDRLQLSFYRHVRKSFPSFTVLSDPQNGVYYVHFFDRDLPGADTHHGKAIPITRFHTRPSKHPDPRLIRWHYKQCAMARIRGFAFGMDLPSTSAEAIAWNS